MKIIFYSVIINILLISLGNIAEYYTIEKNAVLGFLLFAFLTAILPTIGFLINAIFQKQFDILFSNLYVALGTTVFSLFPIEIFKHSSRVKNAKNQIQDEIINNDENSLKLNIDLDFNIVDYLVSLLIWCFLASIIAFLVIKYKKIKMKRKSHT